jgi:hypothetical protein
MGTMRKPAAFLAFVLIAFVGIALLWKSDLRVRSFQEQAKSLDPAQVLVLRTPGGYLEVATLVKTEEFRWRSSYTCLGQDCGSLLGERIGRIRVPVHYTYRVALAAQWTLKLEGDAYVLRVPAPEPRLPPALDAAQAELSSEKGGLLPPGAAANQAILLKNLGPELLERAGRPEYLRQQMPAAEKTVREFAEKWMKEQVQGPARPVRVEFKAPENA